MTAVEWLESLYYPEYIPKHILEQAKQMEADQIIDAHESASLDAGFENSAREWAENYYKLKFKKK